MDLTKRAKMDDDPRSRLAWRGSMVANMEDTARVRVTETEASRLQALRALNALDGASNDPRFDRITRLAAKLFDAPRAAIVLVDEDRLWLKARIGIVDGEYPRAGSMADQMINLGEVVISGDIVHDQRLKALIPTLGQVDVRFYACAPLTDPAGRIVGLLALGDPEPHPPGDAAQASALVDLAGLAMEELLRDAESARHAAARTLDAERVDLAIDAAHLGEYEWNGKAGALRVSARMAAIIGDVPREISTEDGDAIYASVHPDDRAATKAACESQVAERGRFEVEYRCIRPDDGRLRWIRSAGVLVRDGQGAPEYVIGVVQDVTERRERAEQRENLLTELDHRIKNLLAVVQSVAAQSARKTVSLDAFLKTFAGRLKAMSSAHDLLSAARWRGATLARIATAELGGVAPTQTRWDGPELFLTPRAAAALSLTLHELAVNAVKYGALSTETGRVEIVWRRSPDGGFGLEWLETGGPPTSPPSRRGFGSTLVESVVGRELGGSARVDYHRGGVSALILAGPEALAETTADTPAEPEPDRIVETLSGADNPLRSGAIAGLKVLIVEDSLLLALELEAGLEDSGVTVVGCAAELGEALAMLDRPFDAAVLDADLNGQSVAPVAEILRRQGRPFVFATGYADKAGPMGFDAPIVRKPYNISQIARALAEVTGRR
ncbi:MAG: signal transduction histidine kinase [Caulobacter sp.]|nr:signal transduction histidine kinase [Caulobacter sp.]